MFLFTSILKNDSQGGVSSVLQRAARATGTDFSYLLNTAKRESALDPQAKAPTSSAAGLFQFIESTWIKAIHDWGARYGLANEAASISEDSNGNLSVDSAARDEILNLRYDPEVSALMAGELTRANSQTLQAGIGRQPTSGELYIAHFLGAGGASDLINGAASNPDGIAAERFPAAARANRSIFYDRSGTPRGNAEVYSALVAKHGQGEATQPVTGQPMALTAFASARRSEAMFQSLFTDTGSQTAAFAPTSGSGNGGSTDARTIGEAVQNLWLNFFGKPHVEPATSVAPSAQSSAPASVRTASTVAKAMQGDESTSAAVAQAPAAVQRMPNGRNYDPARLVAPGGS
ncbi:MAG: lytic transglycosylase domain-containing protein [Rhodobiaceae bacterium]|nr:lytic transglycosylase domain-containing protein [Rhodobiaceae bacterium]MCC0055969.1 lytic transglycosylase domain-containing protein [Rhodobiaceae bacterium]